MAETLAGMDDTLPQSLTAELDKGALACRILEMEGHATRTLGHMALRDPEGRGFWLKRRDITFGEVYDWRDFVLVDFDGKQLMGRGERHSEWPIHAEILKCRPDINVTVHSHPLHGRVFSASKEPLRPVSNPGNYFLQPPPRFETTSELIRTAEVGRDMAQCLGDNSAIFLRNHGVVFCGATIAKATIIGIQLEVACQEQLMIMATGTSWSTPEGEEQTRKFNATGRPATVERSFKYYSRRLAATVALGHPSFPGKPMPFAD